MPRKLALIKPFKVPASVIDLIKYLFVFWLRANFAFDKSNFFDGEITSIKLWPIRLAFDRRIDSIFSRLPLSLSFFSLHIFVSSPPPSTLCLFLASSF